METWLLIVITFALIVLLLLRIKKPKYLKTLSQEEFKENYRKAQLIDVREEREFKTGHILGARNIPLSQMKQRMTEIRPDKPVYLYCQNGSRTVQAAKILRKKRGAQDLNHLKGGFRKWTGKIKK
ncbi:rhodanese-like domain-containing protein [Salipaludibacillus agaradhaerens]|uniref:rhodanese-like domain-containing protein n=1 Tax=Salipaludibacillus agaradhaerens TaxID=76935 RepID=UPI002151D82C|nr:rhodanese-like domain-containing protein [Salipaludibacillus agaradhaerens]MCR6106404.1 rhodanese-like domain-containing protein [Salipaludibacillus agaradhaerens]MCR6118437.1 rhodanese-like domain-containing protein [Salipaludibacillus agaradhaerens]UJW57542.1 rhodanese-like domain-containing protein [Bacillus sp. A116_S68]